MSLPTPNATLDADALLKELTLDEKVELLAGQGASRTTGLPHKGILSFGTIHLHASPTSDGPHGIRGARSFGRVPSCMLPCATSMGATFNVDLIRQAGNLLEEEARFRGVTRFEAFGEDPLLSGMLAAAYINGVQSQGVAACIKHFAAHDQSANSIEDNVCATERTLREVHLLPFQLAMRHSDPWTFMASYNKINGIHFSENPFLLKTILRDEWGFNGLVMSDWFGTYSTSESVNAGMDLEMPGPTLWLGKALSHAVNCRKVSHQALDDATRNALTLVNKVKTVEHISTPESDTQDQRALIWKIASEGIVLLKNDKKLLPLTDFKGKKFGLIGDHVKHPAICGGGSSEVKPYYSITPYNAIVEEVGEANVSYAPGCYTFRYSPFLQRLACPGTDRFGWSVEIFGENPDEKSNAESVLTTVAEKPLIDVPENLALPRKYFIRARSIFTHQASKQFRFGFGVSGKGLLKVDGKVVIDQWTDQPPKTDSTPCYDRLCTEKFCTVDVTDKTTLLEVVMVNENVSGGVGTALTLAGRVGGFEPFDGTKASETQLNWLRMLILPS
ncbi:hypothetical protein CEP53_012324 [Fusarium sp. AF-6]|nr:hypothetical protein CEP53_012324 [Fusarium sp. AF-6]